MKHKDVFEAIPKRLKFEQNIALIGAYILAVSADVAAISPKTAEYPAIGGGGIFLSGIIATAIDMHKLRAPYNFSPDDDPEGEDIDPMGEIVEFPVYETFMPEEKAA